MKRMKSNTKLKSQRVFCCDKEGHYICGILSAKKESKREEKIISSHRYGLLNNIVEIIWHTFLSVLKKSKYIENVQKKFDSVSLVTSSRRLRCTLNHLIFAYMREIAHGQFFNVRSFNELNGLRWKLDKFR